MARVNLGYSASRYRPDVITVSVGYMAAKGIDPDGGGGGSGTPVETALEGVVEGSADVVSVPELKAAATTTESPTETAF